MSHREILDRVGAPEMDEEYLRSGVYRRVQDNYPPMTSQDLFSSIMGQSSTLPASSNYYNPQQQQYYNNFAPGFNSNSSGYPHADMSYQLESQRLHEQLQQNQNLIFGGHSFQQPSFATRAAPPPPAHDIGRSYIQSSDGGMLRYPQQYQNDPNLGHLQAQISVARAAAEYQLPSFAPSNRNLSQPVPTHGMGGGNTFSSILSGSSHFGSSNPQPGHNMQSQVPQAMPPPPPPPPPTATRRSHSPPPTPMQLVQQPSYLRRAHENDLRYRSSRPTGYTSNVGDPAYSGLSQVIAQVNATEPTYNMIRSVPNPLNASSRVSETIVIVDQESTDPEPGEGKKKKEQASRPRKKKSIKPGTSANKGQPRLMTLPYTYIADDGRVVLSEEYKDNDVYKGLGTLKWYMGCTKLEVSDETFPPPDLQTFIRTNLLEAFAVTAQDITSYHCTIGPLTLGQVGLRCVFCKNNPCQNRSSFSFPSRMSRIYSCAQELFREHFYSCSKIPEDIRLIAISLEEPSSVKGGRKNKWIESAKRIGLMDTPHGIHFAQDPNLPLPTFRIPAPEPKKPRGRPGRIVMENESSIDIDASKLTSKKKYPDTLGANVEVSNPVMVEYQEELKRQHEESYPLVTEEDRPLITDALFITLEQMEACKFVEFDRVGVYKGRHLGFKGIACKHCQGQAGAGRYFPSSEASLSQTTTSMTFINHMRRCRYVPKDIRDRLEAMPSALESPDNTDTKKGSKKSDKPLHGGRKVFFHRLWCRVQELEIAVTDEVEIAWEIKKASKVSSKLGDENDDDQGDYEPSSKNNLKHAPDKNISSKRYRRVLNMTSRKRKERDSPNPRKPRKRMMRVSQYSEPDSNYCSDSDDEENESWNSGSTPLGNVNDDEMNEVSVAEDEDSTGHGDESDDEMSADMTKMVETAARWLTELDQGGATASISRPPKGRGRGRRPPNIDEESNYTYYV